MHIKINMCSKTKVLVQKNNAMIYSYRKLENRGKEHVTAFINLKEKAGICAHCSFDHLCSN